MLAVSAISAIISAGNLGLADGGEFGEWPCGVPGHLHSLATWYALSVVALTWSKTVEPTHTSFSYSPHRAGLNTS